MNPTMADVDDTAVQANRKEMSDGLLVLAAQSGDGAAFEELRRRHSTQILRTVYRITRNWADAEDVLQEALLKAFTKLKTFEGRSSFSSWLTRIAINSALMVLRKKRGRFEISLEDGNDDLGSYYPLDLRDPTESLEHQYIKMESKEALRRAILRLPRAFRDVVELQCTTDYSNKEIARALEISVPAAKSRLLRARMALRSALI